jgi:decaprenylphospho-beta-D-erythro-pentofuranosid-2-ulose 2-reductase
MRDGLGRIETVAVIGATSDIGVASARALAAIGANRYLVAGRPSTGRSAAAAELDGEVVEFDLDLTDTASLEAATARLFEGGDVDVVILAGGVLIPRPSVDDAVEMAEVNYVGTMAVLLTCARLLAAQGHGQLVVLSSAGVTRPRPANYVYGSTKAAIDFAARGVAMELRDSGVTVTVVRPSFVFTKMTAGVRPSPLAVKPAQVATAVTRAVSEQIHGVVWVPRLVAVLAHLLQFVPSRVVARLDR